MTKSQLKDSNDFNLITKWKSECSRKTKSKIEEELYIRYLPLIKNQAHKFYSSREFVDRIQESYFTMIECLAWVNLDKVYNDSNAYRFGVHLYTALHNMNLQEYNRDKRIKSKLAIITEADTKESFFKMEHDIGYRLLVQKHYGGKSPLEDTRQNNYNLFVLKETSAEYLEFRESLTEYEKEILSLMEKGFGTLQIKEKLKEKHMANITYWKNKIKKKYLTFMKDTGIEVAFA